MADSIRGPLNFFFSFKLKVPYKSLILVFLWKGKNLYLVFSSWKISDIKIALVVLPTPGGPIMHKCKLIIKEA